MHPTPRFVLLVALLVPLAALALASPALLAQAWSVALALLVALAGVDAAGALQRSRLLASETAAPEQALRGDPVQAVVLLSGLPGTAAEVRLDLGPGLSPVPTVRVALDAQGRGRALLPLAGARRGRFALRRLWLRTTGPLGLMRRVRSEPLPLVLNVLPNVRRVREAALKFFGSRDLRLGVKVEKHLGDGSEFHALREWAAGMDPRGISWRASARHRRLLGIERRAERSHRVVLAFDTGRLMAEPLAGGASGGGDGAPRLDHAVEAGLLLAWAGLKAGDHVGLFGFDARPHTWVEPDARLAHYEPVRAATADLPYTQAETNFTLGLLDLSARLSRRSLIVVFTDFVDVIAAELMLETLARLARKHLVLFVTLRDPGLVETAEAAPRDLGHLTRAVVAGDLLREREVVLRRLTRLGIQPVDAAPGEVSAQLLSRYLDVKRRELV